MLKHGDSVIICRWIFGSTKLKSAVCAVFEVRYDRVLDGAYPALRVIRRIRCDLLLLCVALAHHVSLLVQYQDLLLSILQILLALRRAISISRLTKGCVFLDWDERRVF